jgi:3-(3-hydroxy-phenyl)propionate hydroxylase
MSTRTVPVVIVGGGPTGITAATLLAQYGVDTVVLERWDDVYPQPRAVHIDDEVFRIVARLGLGDAFAAISRPMQGLRLVDRNMRVLAQLHRGGAPGVNGFPKANMFDQPALEALLRGNARRQPGVELRGGTDVTAVTQDGRGRVHVDFVDRASGEPGSVVAEYVLGCDGANSMVRASIGATMEELRFEQRWLVVDVATHVDLDAWDGVHQVCDPRRAATFMRIGRTRYRWEFRLLPGETADDYQSVDALHPLIAPWTRRAAVDGLELVRVAEYTFRAQIADTWRDRRVFLLGDAAHLTPPFIGQGLCAGLRDAMNLSWKLAGVLDGTLSPSVLDTYETERQPHVRALIRLAVAIGWAMTQGGEAGDLLRRLIAPRLHLVPGMRAKIVDSATPPLSHCAFVRRSRLRPLAGRLCPNPVLDGGRRFDDVVGGRFALVTASAPSAEERAEVERRGAVVVVARPGSELHGWLRRGRATAAVVRPDRTVMRSGRTLPALCATMPTFAPPSRAASPGTAPPVPSDGGVLATRAGVLTTTRTNPDTAAALSRLPRPRSRRED